MVRLGEILLSGLLAVPTSSEIAPSELHAAARLLQVVGVNPSADVSNPGVYQDMPDAACAVAPAPTQVTACTGGNPGTLALNRGMCVNTNCWDVCNGAHLETAYVGAGFDANLATTVPLLILNIRNGMLPNVSCPLSVTANADRQTCGDHGRAGDRCTPLAADGTPRTEDRENLGMCILPNMGGTVECRDMCSGSWEGTGWQVGLSTADRQQIDDVQSSWACGYPWAWLWYLLLFLLVVACIVGALFLAFRLRMRQPKKNRAVREQPLPEVPMPDPEPMNYQQEPQPPPQPVQIIEVPATASIRMQPPMLLQQPPPQQYVQTTMAPQMTHAPLIQSGTRGAVSQQGTFYNPMSTRMPNYAYQGLPQH